MIHLGKYSFGTGDRFGHQGIPQLKASVLLKEQGMEISHVWNKSFREHKTVHTTPQSVRIEADAAVKALGWDGHYFVDADHINLGNVDDFIPHSDFFTIDVADFIGKSAEGTDLKKFIKDNEPFIGELSIPGIDKPFKIDRENLEEIGEKFLYAIQAAGTIYRHIAEKKGWDNFVAEISMDEVDEPQTPWELFFILKASAEENIPIQTIAPKFTGRFNKGVDYVGDLTQFAVEFEQDLLVIRHAVQAFNLPKNLKLSVHSGSDKFSIYKPINKLMKKYDAGVHVKTAGTTWLEELAGIAAGGGDGLRLAKQIYKEALQRFDELTGPYSTVLDVNPAELPSITTVNEWDGPQFVGALKHDQTNPAYDIQLRQFLHCSYKVAAEMESAYFSALKNNAAIVEEYVIENLYEKHMKPIFLG